MAYCSPCGRKEKQVSDIMTTLQSLLNSGFTGILIKGGPVMIPLAIASLISLAIVLERWRYWRRVRKGVDDGIILALVDEGEMGQALKVAHESRHPVARVLHAGLKYRHRAPGLAMEAAAQAEGQQAKSPLPAPAAA